MSELWIAVGKHIMNISTLSLSDIVLLSANIRSIYREKYHCAKAIAGMKQRNKNITEDSIEVFKKNRGCGHVTKHVVDRIGNIEYRTCLCSLTHPMTNNAMIMERNYQNGILPYFGSLSDQPSKAIELMELVRCARIEEENELQAERERKAAQKAKRR